MNKVETLLSIINNAKDATNDLETILINVGGEIMVESQLMGKRLRQEFNITKQYFGNDEYRINELDYGRLYFSGFELTGGDFITVQYQDNYNEGGSYNFNIPLEIIEEENNNKRNQLVKTFIYDKFYLPKVAELNERKKQWDAKERADYERLKAKLGL